MPATQDLPGYFEVIVVSFSLRQITSFVDQANAAPLYRVVNQVTDSLGASPNVFVYKTATQKFDHYASAADMERWPDNYEEAVINNLSFYRVNSVARDWETLAEMYEDIDYSLKRVKSLADELTKQRGVVAVDRTTLIEGA